MQSRSSQILLEKLIEKVIDCFFGYLVHRSPTTAEHPVRKGDAPFSRFTLPDHRAGFHFPLLQTQGDQVGLALTGAYGSIFA